MNEDTASRVLTSNRRGFVLPSVIFAITIMSVIVVVALNTASDERRASRATRESTLAMYAAEAGLRNTYGAWPSTGVKALNPGDSLDLGWTSLPNRSSYRTVIHRVDKGGLQEYDVVVQGRRADPTAGIVILVGAVGGVPVFKYAVYAETIVSLNSGIVDGYDSDVGPYVAATADSTGNIWASRDMYITRTTVKGDAAAVGSIIYGQEGVVTGTATPGATAVTPMDIIPCPTTGFTPSARVPSGPGISYSTSTGVLTVSSGATLALTDSSYFFSSIVLTGNSNLAVPGNPHVKVYLADSLNATGGTLTNPGSSAAALSFMSCGTSATPALWALTGGTQAYYSVYAPNHVVYATGGTDFYGAVVASMYFATGGAKFHYDAALARQPSDKLSVEPGSWAQLPGS
jgi:type II secretory pathway pseudopilin PulG